MNLEFYGSVELFKMPNNQREKHKKWLHHSVIKWRERRLRRQNISMTKEVTYFSITCFFMITVVSCEHSLPTTDLLFQGQKFSNVFNNQSSDGIHITSNSSTLFDCSSWKECSWTWDKDNFTKSIDQIVFPYKGSNRNFDLPGQHGFYSTNAKFIKDVNRKGANKAGFYGPRKNRSGRCK